MWQTLIPVLAKEIKEFISDYIKDKQEAERIAQELSLRLVERQADIIQSEAQSESWLTRNWRPLTMLTFVALIVADWLGYSAPNLPPEMKEKLYSIVETGLMGYIIARSVEKVATQKTKDTFKNFFK